jgi:hypothetical protein
MKQLSERETIVLRAILGNQPHGSTGNDLVHNVRQALGSIGVNDVTPAGVHRTAASLCRKNLAWRAGTSKLQFYKITQPGRDVLDGRSTTWTVAAEPKEG